MNSQCFTYRNDSYLALFDALCYVGVEGVGGEGVVSCLRDIRLLETFSFVKLEFVFLFVQRQRLSLEERKEDKEEEGKEERGEEEREEKEEEENEEENEEEENEEEDDEEDDEEEGRRNQ
uniref:Uncharacterized protein n=1 Tax=Vespula pensylvanica TaxID=30213 RepID=A0A834P8Q0_VESPE|nr:hypothetical protein H0235_005202 [Vespula pensylvanica]